MNLDEIRRKVREAQDIPRDERRLTPDGKAHLDPDDVEALLEVADAARVHLNRLTPTSRAGLIAALARLNGEETG